MFASNPFAVWVNADGHRFVDESDTAKFTVPIIARQKHGTYWVIFDEASKSKLGARGPLWLTPETIETEIVNNPKITKSSPTLEGLAAAAGLPAQALRQSVQRFNGFVEQNEDQDFGRIKSGDPFPARKIETPPFYAMQNFLVTRKSMGGISIDMSAQALDGEGVPVPGLYAAGEVTGVAGINGSVGMSGTFLGPSVMIGRIAARTLLDTLALNTDQSALLQGAEGREGAEPAAWTADMDADGLKKLLNEPRSGYWHFDVVHDLVLERNYVCTSCHSSNVPMKTAITKAELLAQSKICTNCHN